MSDKVWISFKDENNKKVEGFFELIKKTEQYVEIRTSSNTIIIPWLRVNKIKLKGGKI